MNSATQEATHAQAPAVKTPPSGTGVASAAAAAAAPAAALQRIRVRDFQQLRQLAWQLRDDAELTPTEALGLYEREWRHVEPSRLSKPERALIERLKDEHGHGVLLV